jgi:hypothetical protein
VPLGDDCHGAVGHLDRGLVVDGVCGARDIGGSRLGLGDGVSRHQLVIEVREDRELDNSEGAVV